MYSSRSIFVAKSIYIYIQMQSDQEDFPLYRRKINKF